MLLGSLFFGRSELSRQRDKVLIAGLLCSLVGITLETVDRPRPPR